MSASPTSRTLELLRREGWTAQVVERWNPHSKTRLDLGGGIDVLAWRATPELICEPERMDYYHPQMILGVQACASSSHAARKDKLLKEPRMATWVCANARLEVWSWSKKGPRGKRKLWECRREALTLSDFIPADNKIALHGQAAGEDR